MAGYQKITADGVVGASGTKIRLYGFLVNSDGSGSVTAVYDGTSTGGIAIDSLVGAASLSTRILYPTAGILCTNGVFLDIDAHVNYIIAIYEQESS